MPAFFAVERNITEAIGLMNEPENGAYIELNDVWKIYKNEDAVIHALSRINCSFRECSFNIIVGPSGCGKSTLIRIIGLIEKPSLGEVLINCENTSDHPKK